MMSGKMRVYVETSVVSYLTARPSHDVLKMAQQLATRDWWGRAPSLYDLFVSDLVIDEASRGDAEAAAKRVSAVNGVCRFLPINREMIALAERLVEVTAVPQSSLDDAIHIATAAIHRMDYIVSWNCRHIANPQTKPLIRKTCEAMGFIYPEICTPFDMIGGSL